MTAAELLAADIAPRRDLLGPLLANDSAALVYGPTGIGKSFFALSVAWAVASGGSFLGWQSPRPHRVLYVDGEMGAAELRARLARFGPPPPGLRILALDLSRGPLLDLSEDAGLERLMTVWGQPNLLVLDTLSALTGLRTGHPERWDTLQRFLRYQRERRRATLMVHHANRMGRPRGTSKREDAVDLTIALSPPPGRQPPARPRQARFEIRFGKTRTQETSALVPTLATLRTDESGQARWLWGPPDAGRLERAVELFNRGLTTRQAMDDLGIARATLFRLKAEARAKGLLNPRSLP